MFVFLQFQRAFECIMHLWDKKPLKVHGERMSESILAILCHLLKGESIIQEKLAKERDNETTSSSAAIASNTASNAVTTATTGTTSRTTVRLNELEDQGINADHLQQLMDMGFARELALDALLQTTTLEQATDYLLSHPGPLRHAAVSHSFVIIC